MELRRIINMHLVEEIIMIIPRVKIAIDSVIDLTSEWAVSLKGKISFFDLGQCRISLQLIRFAPCFAKEVLKE